MDQHVHMRTGWWMPFVFCIDGNHDVIPIKHHRWCQFIRERERERKRERDGWHDHVPNDSLTYISFR